MPKTAAVLFDLDGTLLDRAAALAAFLDDQFQRFSQDLGDVTQETWRARFIALDERGYVHKSIVYPAILAAFGGRPETSEALLSDYRERSSLFPRPFPGMVETLKALRARGLKLAIVTNGEAVFQSRNIAALGLIGLVDEILISEKEGLRKPDAALFHRAAERLNVAPAKCVFVGDNPSADVLGAHAAGMRALWFSQGDAWPEAASQPGPTIRQLPDVLAHVG